MLSCEIVLIVDLEKRIIRVNANDYTMLHMLKCRLRFSRLLYNFVGRLGGGQWGS